MPDTSGHDQTQPDELHTVPIDELEQRVAAAGVLISRRQLLRHCEGGTFVAKKLPAFNNQKHWFVSPASIEKGIADIKTLQEHRARRDASRPDASRHDGVGSPDPDVFSNVPSKPAASDKKISQEENLTDTVVSGHVATNLDIFEHPYVKKLESQVEKWEGKYHEQVRRTEEIQVNNQKALIELQRMTAVGQSQTLADFMLKAKEWVLGQGSGTLESSEPHDPPAA